MTSPKPLPWYQNFQIMAYVVAGLAALGTAIAVASKYINLPKEVEAAQQKNTQQDEAINKLTGIQETWQQIYQQQQQMQQVPNQPRQRNPGLREFDATDQVFWCCPSEDREACYAQEAWRRCD